MIGAETMREAVRKSLPELAEIKDPNLREKVVDAWVLALAETEFQRIEDIPGIGGPDAPPIKNATQVEHLRVTAQFAIGMMDAVEKVFGPYDVNRDEVIAGALLHDVGKAFELSPRNRARWEANPHKTGLPPMRHPVYGVHIVLQAGLPESIAHIVGSHSRHSEGQFVETSLEAQIVQFADYTSWRVMDKANMMEWPMWVDGKLQLRKKS